MSRLEELIQELCPDGVEYKSVGDLCSITRGRVMSKDYIKENAGDYPVYSSQTENNGELGRIMSYDFEGEYVTWTTDGANAGSVFYRNGRFSITNVCGLLKPLNDNINTKFLYYALSIVAQSYVNSGMGNPKLMSNVMSRVKVPVPPLEVQHEIVRILDRFTELTAELTVELTAELTARKQQYEYYRDKILLFDEYSGKLKELILKHFPNGVEYKPLNFIASYSLERIDASRITSDNYVGVDNLLPDKQGKTQATYVPTEGRWIHYSSGDILIGNIRPYLKKIWFANCDGGTNGDVLVVHMNSSEELIPKFLYYVLSSDDFFLYDMRNAKGAKMPRGNKSAIMNYKIPVPPLSVQQEIIRILDNFDSICSDLTSGLPAEIEARQKQYEYYRDKLLTFNEKTKRTV